ncbi:unnamed protein product [Didymodactylos carnosus]|uniref:Uncharacterized protein n=1 Tax=Didymodactylos carnosus TaxID=1234261 RepID=A0A814ANX0_9BILA|nr:unnamed protein product [Didymodactylos carnosus]CAF0914735.1 unnamed protein product [Didymodactylos carnosus]CAF3592721.1 unnamed protein product [Didymodactylos carnosus]CAF3695195.1 unnamed protein product [Didymodactylos carnosus]
MIITWTKLSVLLFGLCYVRYNPNHQWSSTIKILLISIIVSLSYAVTQGIFEFHHSARPSGFIPTYNLYAYVRRSFYYYCLVLAFVNLIQVIGTVLNFSKNFSYGMCIVDATTILYFVLLGPFVYLQFLRRSLQTKMKVPQVTYAGGDSIEDEEHDDLDYYSGINDSSLPVSSFYNQIQSNKRYFGSTQSTTVDFSYNDDDVPYPTIPSSINNSVIV